VAAQLGFHYVHTSGLPEKWLTGSERAELCRVGLASGVEIGTMFIAFDGQSYADWATIARTVGWSIRQPENTAAKSALAYINLALRSLVPRSLAAHIGFLPKDGHHANYGGSRSGGTDNRRSLCGARARLPCGDWSKNPLTSWSDS